MTPQEFEKFYPVVASWIRSTLMVYSGATRTVTSCGFPRLPFYFSAKTLASTKVVLADRLPLPPLSSWGLTDFADFERSDPDGVTYLDTFFVKRHQSKNEAIHFHELIHVIQWRFLGPEKFLRAYADGLNSFGYRNSLLEIMAYDAEKRFVSSTVQFDAEQLVAESLMRVT
jgi:hypothetical protein